LVLVVDDDPEIRASMQAVLEAEGYRVATANDGWEGLKLLDQLGNAEPPCAVLLDLMMPRMDGFEFRAAQLARPALAPIPVAVFTAFRHAPGIDAMRVQGVFQKPADVGRVLDFVAQQCRPAPTRR
jgi:CheY-like chemotaxis protein